MLARIIQAILAALFGAIKKGIEEKRDDQAKVDLGATTQAAATSDAVVKTQAKMATASKKARKTNVKNNLRGGTF